ncbi:MAG: Asp-tRNA(Asn)/Glu-tRNA(Gln) amidotransferase GatCAB subunit A, partial [Nitrososphaeria archaeon]|nr:Asp-tRNA(Asn)/Glu-tRNA(Gln) amidotransferase GatCAB subunit A [Nitrososphaeria archaeon]
MSIDDGTYDKVQRYCERIKAENRTLNAIVDLSEKQALESAERVEKKISKGEGGVLAGLVLAVKSNINVRGLRATCSSHTLEDYVAGYDATVVERLRREDAIIIGTANMDEFACGSSGETSCFGPTLNPSAKDRIPGGSSSGSAASVAAEFCDASLGSDTGGSIRNPSSHCGVIGFKPTYGRVSRYGLIDLAMSLDQIGPIARDTSTLASILDVISGYDPKDATTIEDGIPGYVDSLGMD